jgi:hypothetical protein
MKIDRLSLRCFRSYVEASIDLAPGLNIIAGLNGSGKSTLLDAIAIGLTGTARGSESGRGHEDLRRHGDRKKWSLQIKAGPETFTRQEGEGPRAAVQQRIEAVLGVPGSVIRACLYSGELLRLERKDAQRMILDLAKPAAIDLPAEIRELCAGLKMLPPEATVSLADLERLYRDVYAKRTDAGRALKAIGAPDAPVAPAGLEGMSLAAMDDQRRVIGTKIADLERQRDQAVRAEAEAKAAPAKLKARMAEYDLTIANAQEKLSKYAKGDDIKLRVASLSKQIRDAEEGRGSAGTAHREAQQRLANAQTEVDRVAAEIAAVEAAPDACPACGSKVSAIARKKNLEAARDRAKAADAELAAARNQAAEAASILKATPDLKGLERQLVELNDQEGAASLCMDLIADQETRKGKAAAELAALEGSGAEGVDVEALATRITEGRRRLDLLTGHAAAVRAYEQATAGRGAAEAEREKLDRLCELLGPDGIRKELAGGGGVQDFQAAVNGHLEPMGFRVDLAPLLALEDDALVNGLPTRMLSSSEQIRFGLAFQVAVASACGLGLVVVDDFDRLDPGSKAAALAVLSLCPHQVIVLSTITSKTPEQFVAMAEARNVAGGTLAGTGSERFLYVSRDAEGRSTVEAPGRARVAA